MKLCLLATGSYPYSCLRAAAQNCASYAVVSARILLNVVTLYICLQSTAQDTTGQATYLKNITERSDKIVRTLDITDSAKYRSVLALLVNQYAAINSLQQQSASAKASIQSKECTAEEKATALRQADSLKATSVKALHQTFIASLNLHLDSQQLEKVKDGMTFRVLPVTYAAYQDMLLNLTEAQKQQIYAWLVEAREIAMNGESSEKKHAVFGKYKGRINNYLSAAGYDLKKETEAWQQRIKERKKTNN